MIPISLKIKGLYSYQETQVIDFRRLTEASLFGIFGKVGSGKSSILDAILYALYENVDRLDNNGMKYNLMNLNSKDIFIEFEFDVNGKQYLSRVTGRRDDKTFEKVTINQNMYENTEGGNWTPTKKSGEEITGLSFENFRRTIIIPQNKFQEFLTLAGKDRAKMMKELFRLDKFELYDRVTKLQTINAVELNSVKKSITEIGEITEETIKNHNAQLVDLLTFIENLQKEALEKTTLEKTMSQLKEQFDLLDKLGNTLKNFEAQKPQFEQLEQQILAFDFCEKHFKALFDNRKNNEIQLQTLLKNIDIKKQEEARITQSLDVKKVQIAKLEPDYKELDIRRKQVAELRQLLVIRNLQKKSMVLIDHVENAKKTLENMDKDLTDKRLAHKTSVENLEKMRQDLPDPSILAHLTNWFFQKKSYESNVLKVQKKVDECELKINSLRNKKIELIAQNKQYHLAVDAPIDVLIQSLENHKIGIEQDTRKTFAQQHLIDISKKISETEPCPLCGSVHHPLLLHTKEAGNDDSNFKTQIIDYQIITSKIDTLIRDFEKLKIEYQFICDEKKGLQTELEKANEILRGSMETFNFTGFNPQQPEQVNLEQDKLNALQKAIQLADSDIKKQSLALELAVQNREKIVEENKKNETGLVRIESEINTLSAQILNLPLEKLNHKSETELNVQIEQFDNHIEKVKTDYESLQKKQLEYSEKLALLIGFIASQNENIGALQGVLADLENQIQATLQQHNYPKSKVEEILNQKNITQKERDGLDSFKKNLFSSQKQLLELQNILRGSEYSSEVHQTLANDIKETTHLLQTKNREVGALRQLIEKMKFDYKRLQFLAIEYGDLSLREEDLKTFAGLFRGNAFVDYVSGMHLQNICSAANSRFKKLTRQSMELELNDKNEFQIIDLLNGGQRRSIKTLSGGQIFQASLCLALALADNIQATTKSKQNFFFLDEGFGSLDRESLQTVFETLKALRKENRIVGIISHVEDMKLEIERYLNVTLKENEGSRVEMGGS